METLEMEKVQIKHDLVEYKNFTSPEMNQKLIAYFEAASEYFSPICFYKSDGQAMVPRPEALQAANMTEQELMDLIPLFQKATEDAMGRPVKCATIHAQRWNPGSFAPFHSDNSDLEGTPSAWLNNKFVSILYMNNDYEGGTLDFRDHNLSLKPDAGSLLVFPGGIDNVHGVSEVKSGLRYTILAFWDYAEVEYSEEKKAEIEREIARERIRQAKQKQDWEKGIF